MGLKILICEDNERLRSSLCILIDGTENMEIVGAFGNTENILSHVERLKPNVIIMDIDMPEHDGIEGVQIVKKRFPEVKIIMHTVFDDDDRLFTCLSHGADGYILKKDASSSLFNAIKEVLSGGAPMSAGIATRVLQTFRKVEKPKNDYNITEREKQILELLTRGFSYRMIGIECKISIETVRRHLKNIYHKLHVQCGTEAVAKAIGERLLLL